MTKKKSLYQEIASQVEKKASQSVFDERVNVQATIRKMRKEKGLAGVELCKRAQDLDPRTLTALEKGRIKNPSIKTLESVARGLNVTISDLFRQTEAESESYYYSGGPKGAYHMEFPSWGVKVISYTPLTRHFFCGKLILAGRKKMDQTLLKHPLPVFISVMAGKVEITVETKKTLLREGDNLFFNGILQHSFYNPLERESALLLVTAPSFL
jgi:DNA-binding XRE family transcriptional regulator